jgi:hypothetical protein
LVELGGLDQRVEDGGYLGTPARLRAVVILAAYDGTSDRSLGRIVVQRNTRVVEEASEPIPVGDGVRGGLANRERLQHRLRPQPGLEFLGNLSRLITTELGLLLEIAVGLLVDLVQLTDPLERELSFGVVGSSFLELSVNVSPASGEGNAGTISRSRLVSFQSVADDESVETADEFRERRSSLVVLDPVSMRTKPEGLARTFS